MRRRALQISVVIVLVGLALVLRRRDDVSRTPEETVTAFFDAASNGDDEAYFKLVAGDLRDALLYSREQLGAAAFRDNIRRSAAGIKGLAVTRRSAAAPERVALDVDIVFTDRNERQEMFLNEEAGRWVITGIATAAATQPAVAYGTPVYE